MKYLLGVKTPAYTEVIKFNNEWEREDFVYDLVTNHDLPYIEFAYTQDDWIDNNYIQKCWVYTPFKREA